MKKLLTLAAVIEAATGLALMVAPSLVGRLLLGASAIQIVRPLESIAETQPQLQPALLRLSAIISQYFIGCRTRQKLGRTA
jgi:hypothetical protein